MATTIEFFFAPEDEKQFLSFLAQYELTAYPNRIPPDWTAFKVEPATQEQFAEEGYYLAAETLGEVVVRAIKRGKDKGFLEIDETQCPVVHYDRSVTDEKGQLRSGKLWTELNVNGDVQRNPAFPERYRRMWLQIQEWFKTKTHRSNPPGYYVGPHAARLAKQQGTVLREQGRTGDVYGVYR